MFTRRQITRLTVLFSVALASTASAQTLPRLPSKRLAPNAAAGRQEQKDELAKQETDSAARARTQLEATAKASSEPYPDDCNVSQSTAAKTGTLQYYAPFTPSDGFLDILCKIQTFKSKEPIQVFFK